MAPSAVVWENLLSSGRALQAVSARACPLPMGVLPCSGEPLTELRKDAPALSTNLP